MIIPRRSGDVIGFLTIARVETFGVACKTNLNLPPCTRHTIERTHVALHLPHTVQKNEFEWTHCNRPIHMM